MNGASDSDSAWITAKRPEEARLLDRLTGREARVLAYYVTHQTLVVECPGERRCDDYFLVLHGCERLVIPTNWSIERMYIEPWPGKRTDEYTILVDHKGEISVQFYVGRLLSRKYGEQWVSEDFNVRDTLANWLKATAHD